jgi:hypothetical protein
MVGTVDLTGNICTISCAAGLKEGWTNTYYSLPVAPANTTAGTIGTDTNGNYYTIVTTQ